MQQVKWDLFLPYQFQLSKLRICIHFERRFSSIIQSGVKLKSNHLYFRSPPVACFSLTRINFNLRREEIYGNLFFSRDLRWEKNVGISLNLLRRNCMNKKSLDIFNSGRRRRRCEKRRKLLQFMKQTAKGEKWKFLWKVVKLYAVALKRSEDEFFRASEDCVLYKTPAYLAAAMYKYYLQRHGEDEKSLQIHFWVCVENI